MAKMRAARMYGYKQPLRLEEIPIPDIEPTQVLVKVGGAGMCRTDFQLIDGYLHSNLPLEFPVTPGHEIAGTVAAVGSDVPAGAGLSEGDSVAVFGPFADGSCRQCHGGNEQICNQGHWGRTRPARRVSGIRPDQLPRDQGE
jgi:propanol-preferring alcohol dehydrogenase